MKNQKDFKMENKKNNLAKESAKEIVTGATVRNAPHLSTMDGSLHALWFKGPNNIKTPPPD